MTLAAPGGDSLPPTGPAMHALRET